MGKELSRTRQTGDLEFGWISIGAKTWPGPVAISGSVVKPLPAGSAAVIRGLVAISPTGRMVHILLVLLLVLKFRGFVCPVADQIWDLWWDLLRSKMKFAKLSDSTLRERIAGRIKEAILMGNLREGEKLSNESLLLSSGPV